MRATVCVLEGVFSNPVLLLCCSSSKGQRLLLLLLKHTQARARTHLHTGDNKTWECGRCVCVCYKRNHECGKKNFKAKLLSCVVTFKRFLNKPAAATTDLTFTRLIFWDEFKRPASQQPATHAKGRQKLEGVKGCDDQGSV